MHLLLPQNPLMHKLPDSIFEPEFDAASELGFHCCLFDEEALSRGNVDAALAKLPIGAGSPLLYRGWNLTEDRYGQFYDALAAKGYALINTRAQYTEVTYFPNYYPKVRERSPQAVWTDSPDTFEAWRASRKLGDGPFVIKDHVKSTKHAWLDACFVPKGCGRENFERIAENLKIEQGGAFNRGFVVKQYVPLRTRGQGAKEYPQCEEYRLFFWKRRLLVASHYHRVPESTVDFSPFVALAERFDSPFFTMDIAQTETGEWLVIDMGAGECSALPPGLAPRRFYELLATC